MDTSTKMSIRTSSYLNGIVSQNESFDKAILRIAYEGKNRNGSYISKKAFENAVTTMAYVPVVTNYKYQTDEIGSHDSTYIEREGKLVEVVLTDPIGLVPEHSEYQWETVAEKDGSIHEYFCTEVLLWKRQAAYTHIKESKVIDQSMEITVHDYTMVDGVCHINDFTFTAFTLLESADPCFESASLHTFSALTFDDEQEQHFKEQMNEMFNDFKAMYSNIEQNQIKEDKKMTKQFKELIESYGYQPESLDFDLTDMTVELLTSKLEEMKAADELQNFLLSSNFVEGLREAIRVETITSESGAEYPKYSIVDYDTASSEVYAYDLEDWKLYGFSYNINGDVVTVDFDSKKRMKYAIVNFDEGEAIDEYSLEEVCSVVNSMAQEKFEQEKAELQASMDELENKYAEKYSDYEELKQFKADTLYQEELAKKNAVIEKFEEKLSTLEEFAELKKPENMDKYSVDELSSKCAEMYGNAIISGKIQFSLAKEEPTPAPAKKQRKLFGAAENKTDDPYNGIFAEFDIKVQK